MTTTTLILLLAAAFALGALVGWLAQLARERQGTAELGRQLAVARERSERDQELLRAERQFVERSRAELETSFKALAAAALQGTTDQFLTLAEQRLQSSRAQSVADLEQRRTAIEGLLQPLRETLARLEQRTGEIERARIDATARLETQVQFLADAAALLQDRTQSLSIALSGSHVRGRWGEVLLRNVAEAAGLVEHVDFELQETQEEGGRPDMVVRLPGGRAIAVDSKVPLETYKDVCEATADADREDALVRHARALRGHVKNLAGRNYASQVAAQVDMVVLFLPGDPFLAAAFSQDPDLQVDAWRSKVLIATPSTLVALLRTVAIYWQQERVHADAQQILDTAQTLYDRVGLFGKYLTAVGKDLAGALRAFNDAVGSFNTRLLPLGARLKELKVAEQAAHQLEELKSIEEVPRSVRDD